MGALVARQSAIRVSLPRFHYRVGLQIVLFAVGLGVYSRCGLHTRAITVFRDRYPGASDISSPPCQRRLLPAGTIVGWALHPLEKRRLVTAHVESGHYSRVAATRLAVSRAKMKEC